MLIIMQNITRSRSYRLSIFQISGATLLISLYFEWFFPRFLQLGVADYWDVFYYVFGAFIYSLFLNPQN